MNIKRYIFAAIALFVFCYVYETLVHGFALVSIYQQTPDLWRSYDEMVSFAPFNYVVMAFLAIWITFIFTKFYSEGGTSNGLKFGFYIGVLAGTQAAGALFYLPICETLAALWFVTYLVESIIGGLIIGAIYRK